MQVITWLFPSNLHFTGILHVISGPLIYMCTLVSADTWAFLQKEDHFGRIFCFCRYSVFEMSLFRYSVFRWKICFGRTLSLAIILLLFSWLSGQHCLTSAIQQWLYLCFFTMPARSHSYQLQGEPSGCYQGFVDIKTKVGFCIRSKSKPQLLF